MDRRGRSSGFFGLWWRYVGRGSGRKRGGSGRCSGWSGGEAGRIPVHRGIILRCARILRHVDGRSGRHRRRVRDGSGRLRSPELCAAATCWAPWDRARPSGWPSARRPMQARTLVSRCPASPGAPNCQPVACNNLCRSANRLGDGGARTTWDGTLSGLQHLRRGDGVHSRRLRACRQLHRKVLRLCRESRSPRPPAAPDRRLPLAPRSRSSGRLPPAAGPCKVSSVEQRRTPARAVPRDGACRHATIRTGAPDSNATTPRWGAHRLRPAGRAATPSSRGGAMPADAKTGYSLFLLALIGPVYALAVLGVRKDACARRPRSRTR